VGSRSRARARAQASQPRSGPAAAARQQRAGQQGAQPSATRPEQGAGRPASGRSGTVTDAGSPGPATPAGAAAGTLPRSVQIAAIVQAVEAVGVLAAALMAGVDAITGKSYHRASGIAITLIGIATAAALAYVAHGLRSGRRWSRTPAMLTQLFAGIVAIYLIQAPRLDWGIPAIVLAVAGFGALLAPSSIELLTPGRIGKS
jgi:hypothetical protein